MLTHRILPDFRGGFHLFMLSLAIGPVPSFIRSRNCVRMAFTAEVRREGPVIFKVVPGTGAALSGISMEQLWCASLFPHPLLVCSTGIHQMPGRLSVRNHPLFLHATPSSPRCTLNVSHLKSMWQHRQYSDIIVRVIYIILLHTIFGGTSLQITTTASSKYSHNHHQVQPEW